MQQKSSDIFRKAALERLSSPDRLDELMQVTTPQAWLLLVVIVGLLAGAILWSVLARVPTTVQGDGILRITAVGSDDGQDTEATQDSIEAVIFVSLVDAQGIEVGMRAEVTPLTVSTQEHGFLSGTVTQVEDITLDESEIQAGVTSISQIEVVIRLDTAETPTSLAWTLGEGPDATLYSGTPILAEIITDEERPIELILPVVGD